MKGLVSAALSSLILNEDASSLIIRNILLFVLFFVFLNLLVNGILLADNSDKIFLIIFFIGILMGILQNDGQFIYINVLLLGLPILFSRFRAVDDLLFFKIIYSFFFLSTLYLFVEHILLHPEKFFLDIEPVSAEQYLNYSNLLVSKNNIRIADLRFGAVGFIRTTGYLGHILAMPVIISMSAIFFYVLAREKLKLGNTILGLVSGYLCLTSLSTTATLAFIITIIIYELFLKKGVGLLIFLFFLVALAVVGNIFSTGIYLFERALGNFSDPSYYYAFFKTSGFFDLKKIIYILSLENGIGVHLMEYRHILTLS